MMGSPVSEYERRWAEGGGKVITLDLFLLEMACFEFTGENEMKYGSVWISRDENGTQR